jgi:hypothetical protein
MKAKDSNCWVYLKSLKEVVYFDDLNDYAVSSSLGGMSKRFNVKNWGGGNDRRCRLLPATGRSAGSLNIKR